MEGSGEFLNKEMPEPDKIGEGIKTAIDFSVAKDKLPLFEQAAEQTGYKISTIAKEGEDYTFWIEKTRTIGSGPDEREVPTDEKVQRTIKLQPGYVAISVEKPKDQFDHTSFWRTYDTLKQTPPAEQKG